MIVTNLERAHSLPFYSQKEYLNICSPESGYIVDNELYISYYVIRKAIFSKLIITSPVMTLSGIRASSLVEGAFLKHVLEMTKELSVDYVAQSMAHVYFSCIPDGAIGVKWSSPIVDLNNSDEGLLISMHQKHRNVVKKAIKTNVRVEFDVDIKTIHQVICSTMSRQERSSVHKDLLSQLDQKECLKVLFVACYVGDDIQGVAVIPYDSIKGYYLYGGSTGRPAAGALNYMHYQVMLKLKQLGVSSYDLMGYRLSGTENQKILGIQRFKLRFGAELADGFTWKYIHKPLKYNLLNWALTIQGMLSKSPYLGDVIDQESQS